MLMQGGGAIMNKKIIGLIVLVGALTICLVLVLNRGGTPKVVHISSVKDGDTVEAKLSNGDTIDIRYASINAPGRSQTLGKTAWEFHEKLIQKAGNLVVDLKPVDKDESGKDSYGRPLAHVFLNEERTAGNNIGVRLVSEGYARLDVRKPCDEDIASGKDFDVLYAEELIAAQIEAAMNRQGWWGEDDKYAESDVIIAAIKQWSSDEIVYIINRGNEPINLANSWNLVDKKHEEDQPKHELVFSVFCSEGCVLPPGGLLRVHSGSAVNGVNGKKGELEYRTESEIDLYWWRSPVWNQDGDIGILYGPDSEEEVYSYMYPLTAGYWK